MLYNCCLHFAVYFILNFKSSQEMLQIVSINSCPAFKCKILSLLQKIFRIFLLSRSKNHQNELQNIPAIQISPFLISLSCILKTEPNRIPPSKKINFYLEEVMNTSKGSDRQIVKGILSAKLIGLKHSLCNF